jgi:HIT domain
MTDASLPPSPFLALPPSVHVARNELAFAIRDGYPVTPGHTLVIPLRHVVTWFDATREEQNAILSLVDEVKRELDRGVLASTRARPPARRSCICMSTSSRAMPAMSMIPAAASGT